MSGENGSWRPCQVTSSSEHEHAEPLRRREEFCAHHQPLPYLLLDEFEELISDGSREGDGMSIAEFDELCALACIKLLCHADAMHVCVNMRRSVQL